MKRKLMFLLVLIGIIILFQGCAEYKEYDVVRYKAPNWTSDGKIVFVKDHNHVIDKKTFAGYEGNIKGSSEKFILCEINSDGTGFKEITTLLEGKNYAYSLGITNTSSAGDWVVLGMRTEDEKEEHIYIIKKDGTEFSEICKGTYPDFSPDAEKIVYQKPNEGIWMMNRDGTGNLEVLNDENATYPAWSDDGGRIAFVKDTVVDPYYYRGILKIIDLLGTLLYSFREDSIIRVVGTGGVDWGSPSLNAIIIEAYNKKNNFERGFVILYLEAPDSIDFISYNATCYRWSPDSKYLIAHDSEGSFVVPFDLTQGQVILSDKWYLKP